MNITVYCGSAMGDSPAIVEAAAQLGQWIGESGNRLVYGGSSVGLMGVVSRAALQAGAEVDGVEPQFFIDAGVEQHNLTNLFVVETMAERKTMMIGLGDVFVALPGGVGTLEEISEILTRVRLDMGPHECYFLNIDGFYNPLIELLNSMIAHGFFDEADMERTHFPTTVGELAQQVAYSQEHPPARKGGAFLAQFG